MGKLDIYDANAKSFTTLLAKTRETQRIRWGDALQDCFQELVAACLSFTNSCFCFLMFVMRYDPVQINKNKMSLVAFKRYSFPFRARQITNQLLYPLWQKHYSDLSICSPYFLNGKALKFSPIYHPSELLCNAERTFFFFFFPSPVIGGESHLASVPLRGILKDATIR